MAIQSILNKADKNIFFTQICNTTLSICTNYSRAFPNLDNTQSCLFTFVYCRTGKMSKILTNVCTKYMQTKEAKKYKHNC